MVNIFRVITPIIDILIIYLIRSIYFFRKSKGRKRVAISKVDGIGDFIIWSDVIGSLLNSIHLRHGQGALLIVSTATLDFARLLKIECDFIGVNLHLFNRSILYRVRIYLQLINANVDCLYNLVHSNVIDSPTNRIALATGAQKRISIGVYRSKNILLSFIRSAIDWICYHEKYDDDLPSLIHESVRASSFIRNKFNSYQDLGVIPRVENNVDKLYGFQNQKYIFICPDSSSRQKEWPSFNYEILIRALIECNLTVVIGGSNHVLPTNLIEEIGPNCINMVGKTNAEEFFSLIRYASTVVCNDSLAVHLAEKLNVHTVCIGWGGSFGRFIPYEEPKLMQKKVNYRFIKWPCFGCTGSCSLISDSASISSPCVQSISVSVVLDEVKRLEEIA
jgi:ADP-heptose:LPS heptosyltransferase